MTRSPAERSTSTAEGDAWNLPTEDAPYYTLPDYLNESDLTAHDKNALDRADGKLDGKWRGNDIEQLEKGFDTPARTAYQERVVEEVVRREGFGADDTPDLLYLNFKEIDYVGHVWSMNSPEMTDAVRYQDEALKRFVSFLNRQVGTGTSGRWWSRQTTPRCRTPPSRAGSRSRPRRCRRPSRASSTPTAPTCRSSTPCSPPASS